MSQHFLLSPAARTLSLAQIMRMTDAEAFDTFKAIRGAGANEAPQDALKFAVAGYLRVQSRPFRVNN
jgi:hypothetical protein